MEQPVLPQPPAPPEVREDVLPNLHPRVALDAWAEGMLCVTKAA